MKTHILVATDGSDTANKAIDLAAELAAKFDVPLTVGHVLQFGRPSRELARMAEVEHIVESVQKTQQVDFNILSGAGGGDLFATSRPSSDMVRVITLMGDEIVNMAEKAGADMIVMGHRGLGRVRSLLAGSVAQKVNNHAECTVVTVR